MGRKNQEGAIVIEATISLSVFMFLIVTILAIVNICYVQAKVGVLIHGVAKDISNYTYLYTMTGLNEKEKALNKKADYSRQQIGSINTVFDSTDAVLDTIEQLGDLAVDSEFWDSTKALIDVSAAEGVKGVAVAEVCNIVAKNRLAISGNDASSYLRRLGVVDGLDGLNFLNSELCPGGGDDIKIVVKYQVHMLRLLGQDLNFTFEQCAYTKAWCARTAKPESSKEEESGGEDDSEDVEGESEDGEDEPENDEKEEMPPPEETKSVEDIIHDGTRNGSSSQVLLGQFIPGDADTVEQGNSFGMTYLDVSDEDWAALEAMGSDAVRRATLQFLEEQEDHGKTFYFYSDPYYAGGYLDDAVDWLINKGYTFEYDPGIGLYRAVKK